MKFSDDDCCLEYLLMIKSKLGYNCKKCGNKIFCVGKSKYSKRCTKCKYDESATARTMFDKVTFSI